MHNINAVCILASKYGSCAPVADFVQFVFLIVQPI